MTIDLPIGSYLLPNSSGVGLDRIEWCGPAVPPAYSWAVRAGGNLCLSKALEWDHEPMPSSSRRTVEWYHKHRYASPEEAYAFWQRWERRVADDGR